MLAKYVAPDKNLTALIDWGDMCLYYGYEAISGSSPAAVKINDTSGKITVVNMFKTNEYKSFIALAKDWSNKNYIKGAAHIAANNDHTWAVTNIVTELCTAYPGDQANESQVLFPLYEKLLSPAYLTTGGIQGNMTGIGSNTKTPAADMQFINLMNTDKDMMNTITYGIKGVNYTLDANNEVTTIANGGYAPGTIWIFGNTFNAYLPKGSDVNTNNQILQMNKTAKPSPLLGFHFDPTPVTTQIANTSAVMTEYQIGFNDGMYNTTTDYQTFINKLDQAGAADIVTETQKQIDAWEASK
jgi:putative aldouronate transport system substrate-binding protein